MFDQDEVGLLEAKARLEEAVNREDYNSAAAILVEIERLPVTKASLHKIGLSVFVNIKVAKLPVAKVSARAQRLVQRWRALFFPGQQAQAAPAQQSFGAAVPQTPGPPARDSSVG